MAMSLVTNIVPTMTGVGSTDNWGYRPRPTTDLNINWRLLPWKLCFVGGHIKDRGRHLKVNSTHFPLLATKLSMPTSPSMWLWTYFPGVSLVTEDALVCQGQRRLVTVCFFCVRLINLHLYYIYITVQCSLERRDLVSIWVWIWWASIVMAIGGKYACHNVAFNSISFKRLTQDNSGKVKCRALWRVIQADRNWCMDRMESQATFLDPRWKSDPLYSLYLTHTSSIIPH